MRSKREFSKDAISSTKLCTVLGNVFIPPLGKTKYEWFMEWFIVFSWFIITILSIILIKICSEYKLL
jgi:hypothetical protein